MEPSNEKKDIPVYTNEPRTLSVTPDWRTFLGNIEDILAEENLVLTGAVGRWDGVRSGWKPVKSVHDIESFLEDCGTVEVTEDREGRLHILGIHHDGRNRAELSIVARGYDPEDESSGQIDPSMLLPLGYTRRFGSDPDEPESDWPVALDWVRDYADSDEAEGNEWRPVQSCGQDLTNALNMVSRWEESSAEAFMEVGGFLEDWGEPGRIMFGVSAPSDTGPDLFLDALRILMAAVKLSGAVPRIYRVEPDRAILGFTAKV